jgi:hypothetical protein
VDVVVADVVVTVTDKWNEREMSLFTACLINTPGTLRRYLDDRSWQSLLF